MRWPVAVVAAVAFATRATASPLVTDADARDRLAAALVDIEAHMHALRYAEARDAARAALAIGAADPAEVASLARTLGKTSAALDDASEAEHWFTLWLELDPGADLPPGSSPKLTAPLATARTRVDGALRVNGFGRDGHVIVEVVHDVAAAVTSIEVDGDSHAISSTIPSADLGARDWGFAASLRDRYGNELSSSTVDSDERRRASIVFHHTRHVSFWRRPTPYIIASVASAGLGGVFLWRRSVAKDDLADILAHSSDHTFADAESARSRAERHGYLSLASFAAAGAFATVAIIFATRPSEHSLAVLPSEHGLSVLATTPF
jgi:hypothetical protein